MTRSTTPTTLMVTTKFHTLPVLIVCFHRWQVRPVIPSGVAGSSCRAFTRARVVVAYTNSYHMIRLLCLLARARALVGARMANLKKGAPTGNQNASKSNKPMGHIDSTPAITIERAAELSGSTRANIKRAKPIVLADGSGFFPVKMLK